jgi:hypothetical protein
MAAQFDPILYSDWDSIQTVIYEQVGPIQEVAGSPGVYVEGVGYGLAQSQLSSRPYPFTRNIVLISSESQATVEFDGPHKLVVDEVIFFTNFSNSWGGLGIQNNFAKVTSVTSSTRVIVDFNTFSYPPWNFGETAEAQQYFISANQFANLRADLALAVQHITGAVPALGNNFPGGESSVLPVPLKGDIIYHSVYDPYYVVATACDTYRYVNNENTTLQATMPSSATATGVWDGLTQYEIKITWPNTDGFDFVQFFNTGGLIKIDMGNVSASNPASDPPNTAALNDSWEALLNGSFPVFMGAKGKTQMGLGSDPRSIATTGAYDLTGSPVEVFYKSNSGNPYSTAYDDHYVRVEAFQQVFQRDMNIIVTLNDSSTGNTYASSVSIDRKLIVSFVYSIGAVPLSENPNQYVIQRVIGWT